MAIRQTFCGHYTPTITGATEYVSPTLLKRGATSEAAIAQPWLTEATARVLRVRLAAAPGSGKSRTFTFRVNGSNSLLTVTLSDSEIDAEISLDVPITDGDLISVAHVPVGSPALIAAMITLAIDNTDANVSCYGGNNGGETITTATTYGSTPFCGGWSIVGEIFLRAISPTDFSFKRVQIELDAGPGGGNSLTFDLVLNGTPVGLGLVISGASTSGTAVCDIAVGVNDVVAATCVRSGGSNSINVKAGYRVETVTDGEMIVSSPTPTFWANSLKYYRPSQVGQAGSSSESNAIVYGAGATFQMQKLTASIQRAFVTDMEDVQVEVLKNGSVALSVIIPGAGWLAGLPTYATPSSDDVPLEPDDSFDVALVTGSGTTWAATWGFVQVQFADAGGSPAPGPGSPPAQAERGVIGELLWIHMPREVP